MTNKQHTKEFFLERHEGGNNALLVHVNFHHGALTSSLDEFCELSDSAGLKTLELVVTNREIPSPKFFVGTGKVEELAALVKAHEADVVLFNHNLSATQGRNLEKSLNVRVIDRTELILDIFAQRARTFEGKLQVELAQLQHLSTQLVRGWTHLERQKGGIGLRGPGETQLETDRRLVGLRIKAIKKRLAKVASQREQSRKARRRAAAPTVALVGYTNAGKSTLFNHLTRSEVYAADQLFATLDPTLRHVNLPKLGRVILADTVGFIRDLPHDLVAAFRATLEEVSQADLLLHVVDSHVADSQDLIEQVQLVLEEIGAQDVPQLLVYNKIDLIDDPTPKMERDNHKVPERVWISAASNMGFKLLERAIVECLSGRGVRCEIEITPQQGKLRAQLYEQNVVEKEYLTDEGKVILRLRLPKTDFEKLIKMNAHVVSVQYL